MSNTPKHHLRGATLVCIAVSFMGCSDSSDDPEGVSVSVDAATAQQALTELTSNVDFAVTGFSNQPVVAGAPAQPKVQVACTAGGNVDVGGHVNVTPVPVSVDVQIAIAYQGCTTNGGTKIAGDLEFSQTVAAGVGTPLRVETIYQGDVQFSGKVNAKCPVDLNVLVDEAGRAVMVGGSFCGQDASKLTIQVSPRWQTQ